MPNLPWTARQDVSAEDTSLEALLAGNGLPAGARAELRPVADVLTALTARPVSDELTSLAAAQAEFRRHVAGPAQVSQSRRGRSFGLVSRLGVRFAAVAAVVVMGFGGAAAAAYAGALPSSWQQFAHRTIGAPAHGAPHNTRATTNAVRPAGGHQGSRHPAPQVHSHGRPARHRPAHHARPPFHAASPTPWPFVHRHRPPPTPTPAPSPLLTATPGATAAPTANQPVPSPSVSA